MDRKTYLRSVYELNDDAETRDYYNDWAATYDAELTENGYATPARCAAALAEALPDRDAEILDFGCGTGLSGAALAHEGFTTIDGIDIAPAMLARARERGLYRHLIEGDIDAPLPIEPETYDAVTAMGAIGPGAAAASVIAPLVRAIRPRGIFVLSFHDNALTLPHFPGALDLEVSAGRLQRISSGRGPHIPAIGVKSTVYVLRRL